MNTDRFNDEFLTLVDPAQAESLRARAREILASFQPVAKAFDPDQPRDQNGRFASAGEGGLYSSEAANGVYDRAQSIEPKLTGRMKALAGARGAKLQGLQYRVKKPASLQRKIEDRAKERGDKNYALSAEQISDANRYTMIASAENYSSTITGTIDDLRAEGYEAVVKNYWEENAQYKGVNVALTTPDGDKVELQFHTPESFEVKDQQNHKIYEVWRKLDETSPKAVELDLQMRANSDTLISPPSVELVGKMVNVGRELK
jgi:hypothetical protein